MPLYMDRHELEGATAVDLAAAHLKDLEVQGRYGVEYVNYWFDSERQHAFCMARGPSREAVEAVHRESHGLIANRILEVDEALVSRFMGGLASHPPGEAYVDSAFRAIVFTDLAGSTRMTQRLGDAAAMAVLRRHDEIVRDAIDANDGTEVKHTGDGIMASFRTVADALTAAEVIQRAFAEAERAGTMPLTVRIGVAVGEPVTEHGDLFGTVVQLAARLTARAAPRSVLVSGGVRDIAAEQGFRFGVARPIRLKGFGDPVRACEMLWQDSVVA